MNIAALIDRVGATRRRFAGASYSTRFPMPCVGFAGEIELLRSDVDIHFEGGFVVADGGIPFQFTFSIPFVGMSTVGGRAVLSSAALGEVSGTLVATPNGFEFLGRSPSATCALHLQFIGGESFTVAGMLELQAHHVAFSAEPASQWERSSQAKVVALHTRARRQ